MVDYLYYEVPSLERKEEALEYIREHHEHNSRINGSGGLDRYLDDYEGWLEHLENSKQPSDKLVPALTYFLVRESDNKIIGMVNIRLYLNESLKEEGGHIGYGIRPTERQKGYNKINLYRALEVCEELGIEEVVLDCNKENLASSRTMIALGGIKTRERMHNGELVERYQINVNDTGIKLFDVEFAETEYNEKWRLSPPFFYYFMIYS